MTKVDYVIEIAMNTICCKKENNLCIMEIFGYQRKRNSPQEIEIKFAKRVTLCG